MTIEVVILRLSSGLLWARIAQHGQLGRNLLSGRSITNVESAKTIAKARLYEKLGHAAELEIVWTVKA